MVKFERYLKYCFRLYLQDSCWHCRNFEKPVLFWKKTCKRNEQLLKTNTRENMSDITPRFFPTRRMKNRLLENRLQDINKTRSLARVLFTHRFPTGN
jgi:hypothetical protein